MSGTYPFGAGPFGAGPWPTYRTLDVAGLAVISFNPSGALRETWALSTQLCETGTWTPTLPCETGIWTPAVPCEAGTWLPTTLPSRPPNNPMLEVVA